MQAQPEVPTQKKKDLISSVYHLTQQNNAMMKRLINNPVIERKLCVKLERLLEYPQRWEKLNEAERAELIKEAQNAKETLRQLREARPLMS